MPRNGRISQIQKMANATPKARARRQERNASIKMGASPHQQQDEKPPWSCAICWEEFWNAGKEANYVFIPGAKKECRKGHPKGTCHLASEANTDKKWQETLDYRATQTGVEPKPRRAKAPGRKQHEGDKEKDAEIRRLKKLLGEKNPNNSDAAEGGEPAAEGNVDPQIARHNSRIAYYLADVANAKRDLARGNVHGEFVHLANQRIEDGERYVAEARLHVSEIKKASMDPHEALAEESQNNKTLKRRLEELGKVLVADHERFERAKTTLAERRDKYRQQHALLEASTLRLKQHSVAKEAQDDPKGQLEAVHQSIVGQYQNIGPESLEEEEGKRLADAFSKYQAMAAEFQGFVAHFAAKQTATKAANTAASSATAPVAPNLPPPHQGAADLSQQSACPAADAPKTWAQTVAKQPATGAPVTPQKPARAATAGTGSATKTAPASIDQIMALDLTGGTKETAKESGKQSAANKRSRGCKDEDDANGMSDEEGADKQDSWM